MTARPNILIVGRPGAPLGGLSDAAYPWEFQPLQKASERYIRNHMDLNILEENKRFPSGEDQ